MESFKFEMDWELQSEADPGAFLGGEGGGGAKRVKVYNYTHTHTFFFIILGGGGDRPYHPLWIRPWLQLHGLNLSLNTEIIS